MPMFQVMTHSALYPGVLTELLLEIPTQLFWSLYIVHSEQAKISQLHIEIDRYKSRWLQMSIEINF